MLGMGAQQQAFAQPNASSGTPNNAPASSSSSQPDYMQRKVFVGNVHADVDVDRLYEYFSQFGEIEEGPLGFDKWTGKPKGFALFFYKSEESASRALEEPMKNFDGKVLNVQKAKDWRTKSAQAGSNSNANSSATAASSQMVAPSIATAASSQMAAPSIAAINLYDPSTYGATAASAQMTAPSIAAINPYDPSTYGATAVQDMAVAQQAAMLGMSAQQQAFVQPNTAMLAMMAAAMQNPTIFAALNPSFAAMDAGGQHTGIPDFGGQGFGPQGFATGGVNFPPAAGGLQGAAAYQGCLPGFQGTPGFPTSAGFQVGQAASQKDTTAAAGATGYQAGPAGQGQMLSSNTDFQGGY
jgi:heterogeneous nuclear ribonucleoprotein A1/A3